MEPPPDIPAIGRAPPPRHSHLVVMHSDHLYLFGGLDDLGAPSTAMYRMHLPPGEAAAYQVGCLGVKGFRV